MKQWWSMCSSVVCMQKPNDRKSAIEVCRDAFLLLIFYMSSHSSNRVSDHPHTVPHTHCMFWGAVKPCEFCLVPSVSSWVFFMVGLKCLRGRSFHCSGETCAPAVLTVIPLCQYSMALFRNFNIFKAYSMLILRTSKYPAENSLSRTANEIFFPWWWESLYGNTGKVNL